MTPQTATAAQERDRAGTSLNAGTKQSPSSPQASPTRSGAASAGTLPDPKELALRTEPPTWMFHIGIHRGTMTSRDSEPPKPAASLDECKVMSVKAERDYASFGCQIWYCYAMSPDGERHTLIEGADYR
jgi:hypothetical protein